VQEVSLELSIGDAVQIGNQILIVVDINDDEICFDLNEVHDDPPAGADDIDERGTLPPR